MLEVLFLIGYGIVCVAYYYWTKKAVKKIKKIKAKKRRKHKKRKK